jgi:hypothetical protein
VFPAFRRIRFLVATGAALTLLIAAVAPVAADAPTMTLVASGLNSPRGVDIGPNGAVYVAEAGTAGTAGSTCRLGPGGVNVCFQASGSITRIWKGSQTRIITGLPSVAMGVEAGQAPEAVGPAGIDVLGNGNIEFTLGNGSARALFGDLPGGQWLGWLLKATPAGSWTPLADVAAFEFDHNPVGEVNANPFGVAAVAGGAAVTDSGGNDLVWTDRAGRVSLVTVFPNRTAALPFPPFGEVPLESVPTSVAQGPDGAWYVGELTGFPFPQGGADVWRVVPGQAPTLYAWGFTNIMDIDFASDGTLYAAELAHAGLLSGPVGALMKAPPGGGTAQTVVTGLFAPGGVAAASDGSVYVSTCTLCAGGGEVWRVAP